MALKIRDLVARLRIVTDKKAAKDVEEDIAGGFGKIEGMAKKAGAAIAAAFAVDKIVSFGKSLITAAADAEEPWNRLANTLENVGVQFANVESTVKLAAKAFEDITTHDAEDFADTLDRLVSLTGDFNSSMAAMPLVADVAAKFFDNKLEPAVDLVGKAITGNVKGLKALGINTKDAAEGLRILAERSKGAAENELKTLNGQLGEVSKAWMNFKEEAGFALTRALTGTNQNITALQTLTSWIKRAGGMFSEEGQRKAQISNTRRELGILERLVEPGTYLDRLYGDRLRKRLLELETEQGRQVQRNIMEAIQAQNFAKTSGGITIGGGKGGPVSNVLAALTGTARSQPIAAQLGLAGIPGFQQPGIGPVSAIGDNMSANRRAILEQMQNDFEQIQNAGVSAAMGIEGAFHDAFGLLLSDFDNLGEAAETFAKGVTGALLGGIGQWASAKVAEHAAAAVGAAAYALGFTAVGNFASTAAAWASAAEHTAAMAAYAALAGGMGAAQGAVAGRGRSPGFSPGGAAGIGSTIDNKGPQTVIVRIDPFNPRNPAHASTGAQIVRAAERIDSSVFKRKR